MSNIYLKVTIETFSNFDFLSLKVTRSVLGSSNSRRYHWILKLLIATYKSDVWEQNCVRLFYYFNFERSYDVKKLKGPWLLLNKNINFNKNQMESKMENPKHSFRETNIVMSCSSRKKKEEMFCTVYFVRRDFF